MAFITNFAIITNVVIKRAHCNYCICSKIEQMLQGRNASCRWNVDTDQTAALCTA